MYNYKCKYEVVPSTNVDHYKYIIQKFIGYLEVQPYTIQPSINMIHNSSNL